MESQSTLFVERLKINNRFKFKAITVDNKEDLNHSKGKILHSLCIISTIVVLNMLNQFIKRK